MTHPTAQAVLDFWFDPVHTPFWFAKSDEFDQAIKDRFAPLITPAIKGEFWQWRTDSYGRLAEILILDQFTRNIHRNTPKAFMGDDVAVVLAQEAIIQTGFDTLPQALQKFTAIPLMHSENLAIHKQAVAIFEKIGDELTLDFEYQHQAIIERFGRYPHRNAILGRTSTPDEMAFLALPNSSF